MLLFALALAAVYVVVVGLQMIWAYYERLSPIILMAVSCRKRKINFHCERKLIMYNNKSEKG